MSSLSRVVSSLPPPLEQFIQATYDSALSFALKLGGETVHTDERLMKRELERYYPSADTTTDAALELLADADQPWYLNVHYWDTHIPYNPTVNPPEFVAERTYEDGDVSLEEAMEPIEGSRWAEELRRAVGHCDTVGDVMRLYDAAAWYADREFGRLIAHLKETGQYEDTAVIITADHGESLTEHGILFEHHGLYDVSTHVPLVVSAPGFEGREDRFVQHFDLVPTILDLVGVEYEDGEFDGQSLVPNDDDKRKLDRGAAFMESKHKSRKRSVRTHSYRYIERIGGPDECRFCEIPHGADHELFEMKKDPGEEENLVEERPDVAAELAERMTSWIDGIPGAPRSRIDFDVPVEQLRELGYF